MSDDNTPEWVQELPEVLRGAPFLSKAETPEQALEQIHHAANYMGRAVKIPTEDTNDDDRNAFYQKIAESVPDLLQVPADEEDAEAMARFNERFGVPTENADYAAPDVSDWEWDPDYLSQLKETAHAAGLNNRQFKKFMTELAKQGVKQEQLNNDNAELDRDKLKQEWGGAFDERMQLIAGWLDLSKAPESVREMAKNGAMGSEAMNWLHETAKAFRDDPQMKQQREEAGTGRLTPLEAQEKIAEILNDPAYFDNTDPRHKILVKRMHEAQLAVAGDDAA